MQRLVFILTFIGAVPLFGQNTQLIDSLKRVVKKTALAEERINALNDLSWEFAETNNRLAQQYARESIRRSQKAKRTDLLSNSYNMLGTAFDYQGNTDSAQFYYEKSLQLRRQNKDWKGVGNVYNNQGACYFIQGNSEKAIEKYLKALRIRVKENDTLGIAQSYNNLGLVYRTMEDYANAIRVYKQSLKYKEMLGDLKGLSLTHLNISIAYQNLQQYQKSAYHSSIALRFAKQLGDNVNIASAYINLASASLGMGDPEKALIQNNKAAKILKDLNSTADEASLHSIFGEIYLLKKQWKKAEAAFLQSNQLCKAISKTETIKENNRQLSYIYERLNQPQKALYFLKEYQALKDSLFSIKNKENVKRLELQFETELRDSKIKQLHAASQVNRLELQASKRNALLLILIIGALVLLISIGGLLFAKLRKQKSMLNTQHSLIQKTLDEREMLLREINHRVKNNMQIIIGLLELQHANSDNLVHYQFIEDAKKRIEAMSLIHELLYTKEHFDLENYGQLYFDSLIEQLARSYAFKNVVQSSVEIASGLEFEQLIPIGLIINELVTNSFKYRFADRQEDQLLLNIALVEATEWEIRYSDFGSATYLLEEHKQSFGTTLIGLLVRQLKGKLTVNDHFIHIRFPANKG